MATNVVFFVQTPNLLNYTKAFLSTTFIRYFGPWFLIKMYLCSHAKKYEEIRIHKYVVFAFDNSV